MTGPARASDRSPAALTPVGVEVILVAHGEAESAGFFENFRVGQRTLAHSAEVMHLPSPLRWLICTLGALRKRFGRAVGSPHNAWTRAQAAALAAELGQLLEDPPPVRAAFASCPPLVKALIARAPGARRRVYVSMSPSDSRLSCGLICHALRKSGPADGQDQVLARLWEDPAFVALNAAHVRAGCVAESPSRAEKTALVLTFHGTLVRDRNGRAPEFHTGLAEKRHFAAELRSALLAETDAPWGEVVPAYLNHDVAGSWTQPTVARVLDDLAQRGFERVWAFACDYVVDSSEVIGSLAKTLAASPVADARLLPCLNASPGFIAYLAGRVRQALDHRPRSRTCDACPLYSPDMGTSGAKSKLS